MRVCVHYSVQMASLADCFGGLGRVGSFWSAMGEGSLVSARDCEVVRFFFVAGEVRPWVGLLVWAGDRRCAWLDGECAGGFGFGFGVG